MDHPVWDLKSELTKEHPDKAFDCMIAEFLLSYGRNIPNLEKTLAKYKVSSLDDLAVKQREAFEKLPDLYTLFQEIELPLTHVLWKMEQRGIELDTRCLKKIGSEIDRDIIQLEHEIKKIMGETININSPTQIGIYLAEKEGVPLTKTRTGKFSTNENELSQYKDQFPIIATILSYRALAKLRSTYIDTLIDKVDTSSRIHTTYHQAAVSTGRLASTNPNLQNIPVNSEYGLKIKSCFQASEGCILASFDYSQQELRILAHLTGEEKLIEAFIQKRDVHKTTASQLFDVTYDDVTSQQRSVGKTINFGIIYGMSSYGLSQSLSIPTEDAQIFIDTFYQTYPRIKEFYDGYFKKAKANGFVSTMFGRRRYVFEYPGQKFIDNSTRRVLLNYPIQGSAADLMKQAMITIDKTILPKFPNVHMLLQIHDDLVFEIPDNNQSIEIIHEIKSSLCNTYPLSVPIEVDVKLGKKWGSLQPMKI